MAPEKRLSSKSFVYHWVTRRWYDLAAQSIDVSPVCPVRGDPRLVR
jgi:hypothetical protein